MASHSSSSNRTSSSALLQKLIVRVTKKPSEAIKSDFKFAYQMLNSALGFHDYDEFTVFEKIKSKLMRQERSKDAVIFTDLYRKLQTSTALTNRASVLNLLCCLYDSETETHDRAGLDLEKAMLNSEVNFQACNLPKQVNVRSRSNDSELLRKVHYKEAANKAIYNNGHLESPQSRVASVAAMFATANEKQHTQSTAKQNPNTKCFTTSSNESNLGSINLALSKLQPLLRDVLFAVQGLKSETICWDPEKNNFNVVFNEDLPNPAKRLTLRFIEIGQMYFHINQYCKIQSNEKSLGLVGQSFIAALKTRLTSYLKITAQLESFLKQEITLEHLHNSSSGLTLHRLSVWFFEPHAQLKIFASLVDACKDKKGGALASVLYSYLQHGNSDIRSMIQGMLRVVTRPLFKMLSNWIYCGELEDAYGEFFVVANIAVPNNCLWQEKYSLNKAMIPTFITMEQARKILSTGKAINFLRQVCQDNAFVRDESRHRKALEFMTTGSIFSQDRDIQFGTILQGSYVKTSKLVLNVLHSEYNLMDHLLAMRNYFLLGQGDFIRHLMDLLDSDLDKPAQMLHIHDLSGIVESAIRMTNAQFHNPEVLQRLDVRILDESYGDIGLDVFSLDYHTSGPIGTVFNPQCMNSYLRLFAALWRAKRMEYVLNKISQVQTTYLKIQEKIPEVTPVLYQCHRILSQMVHFVQQMQYYMAFEVIECCWADLLLKMSSARDLDQVIAAHELFLDTLLTRALLDEESLTLRTQLKTIYDLIIRFYEIQESFWKQAEDVVSKLNANMASIEANTNSGTWGTTDRQQTEHEVPLDQLKRVHIPSTKAQLRVLSYSFEDVVQKFLIMLNDHDDPNLRFLSFRLDFNEYFKNKNSRLQTSLTYQHRRKSIK